MSYVDNYKVPVVIM